MEWDGPRLAAIRSALLDWYDVHRRDLPWRAGRGQAADPYRVWLSEVMLQQTRVETVRPYFERWLEQFPDLHSLAAADPDRVLKAWEGLGYYSRARNFQRAVREVVGGYGGTVPSDPAVFRSLPGVGRYTAGAVMSIAFGLEEPVVDGNVRRVFSRLLDLPAPADPDLWRLAADLVIGSRPGDLNQAMMELGATVCTPRAPRCRDCPVTANCGAAGAGTVDRRPVPRVKPPVPTEHYGVAVIAHGHRLLLTRRPAMGRLGGLWEFPASRQAAAECGEVAARRATLVACGGAAGALRPLGIVRHRLTHVQLVYEAFIARFAVSDSLDQPCSDDRVWIAAADLDRLALPRAQRRIADLLLA